MKFNRDKCVCISDWKSNQAWKDDVVIWHSRMAPDKVLRMLADNKPSLSRKSNVTPPKKKKRRERERKEKEKERKWPGVWYYDL